MIPPFCTSPRCPIIVSCKKKFQPAVPFTPRDRCVHRPAPFVPLHLPDDRHEDSVGGYLSKMAKQEHTLRVGAGERVDQMTELLVESKNFDEKMCKKYITQKKDKRKTMARVTETRVRTYERDVPKTYGKHEGRVRGWVPEGSKYAEGCHKKKR